MLLIVAALFALLAMPAAPAAEAMPPAHGATASAKPCPSPCPDMPGDCGSDCIRCDAAMASCRAGAGCGTAVAVEPVASMAAEREAPRSPHISPTNPALHGRSIKPETHPPSVLDQHA